MKDTLGEIAAVSHELIFKLGYHSGKEGKGSWPLIS